VNIDSNEDQIVEQFKNWWAQFGNYLITFLIIISVGVGGFRYWDTIQSNKAKDASVSFESVLELLNKGEKKKAQSLIKNIKQDFPNLAYTQLAMLLEANILVTENNYKGAEEILIELIDSDPIKGLTQVAASRLARLYLAQKKPEKAMEVISNKVMDKVEGGLWELRADIAAAMGENEKALVLYNQALEQSQLLGYPTNNIILKKNNLPARRANSE
tara:strand:+ start:522 stop:1169 length:648 start_codon:yes stop_codon:yes gene_type:complete